MNCDLNNDLLKEKLITTVIQKPQATKSTESLGTYEIVK